MNSFDGFDMTLSRSRLRRWPVTPSDISNRYRNSCGRKFAQHALDQRGGAIFLDLLDPAVLDPPHHAILIVIAQPGLGDVVALRLDHDIVALGDEVERQGSRPTLEERTEMPHQAVLDRVVHRKFMR